MHVLTTIAQIVGYGWLAVTALLLLAVLVDIAAERLRERRIEWQRQRDQRRVDREFTKMVLHPASAGRCFVSGERR